MTKQQEVREGILHEICCICVHKPTSVEDGLFEDSPKTLKGTGCTYGYDEESNQYCPLAHKVANAIMRKQHSQSVVVKVERELPKNPYSGDGIENLQAKAGYMAITAQLRQGYDECKRDMAGYEAVEPLIEE